jgi:hypothetical protein
VEEDSVAIMVSNTTSDDQPSLDAVAANLQETAKSTLETAQKNAKEGQEAGVSLVQKVATVVLDKGNQAADSSKTYLANVVHQVEDFAEHASHSGVPQGVQDSVSKALHLGGSGAGAAAADQPSSNNTNGSNSLVQNSSTQSSSSALEYNSCCKDSIHESLVEISLQSLMEDFFSLQPLLEVSLQSLMEIFFLCNLLWRFLCNFRQLCF